MNVLVHPDATQELLASVAWYDERQPGLGAELLSDAQRAVEQVAELPESAPRWPPGSKRGARRRLLALFPFAVVYVTRADEIVVLAFAHAKRRPRYWASRE